MNEARCWNVDALRKWDELMFEAHHARKRGELERSDLLVSAAKRVLREQWVTS